VAIIEQNSLDLCPGRRLIADFWRQIADKSRLIRSVLLANPPELIFVSPAKRQPD
jgi:hypothetical protein